MTKNAEEFNSIEYPYFLGIDFNTDPQDIELFKLAFGSQNAICNVKRGSIQLRPGFGRVIGDLLTVPPSIIPELNGVYIPGFGWQNDYDAAFSLIASPNSNLELDVIGNIVISFTSYGGSSLGITTYNWDFEYVGSATIDQSGTSESTNYNYTTPGVKVCRVWGTGTDGNEYAATVSIKIGAYQAPAVPGGGVMVPLPPVTPPPGRSRGPGGGGKPPKKKKKKKSPPGYGEDDGKKKKNDNKKKQLPIPELGLKIKDYPNAVIVNQTFGITVMAINIHNGTGLMLPRDGYSNEVIINMISGKGTLSPTPATLTFNNTAISKYSSLKYSIPQSLDRDTFQIQAVLACDASIRSPVYNIVALWAYTDIALSTSSEVDGTEFTFTVTMRTGYGNVIPDWSRIISVKKSLVSPVGASYSITSGNADTFTNGVSNVVPVTISDIGNKPIVVAFEALEPQFASNRPEITIYPASGYLEIVVPDTIYSKTPFTMTLQAKDNAGVNDITNHNNEAYSITAVDESGNQILLNGSSPLTGTLDGAGAASVSVTYSSTVDLGNSGIFDGTAGTIAGETTTSLSNAYYFEITSGDYDLDAGVAQTVTVTAKAGGNTMTGYNGAVNFSLFAINGNSDTSAATINLSSVTLASGVGTGSLTVTDVSLPAKSDLTFAVTDGDTNLNEPASRRDFSMYNSSVNYIAYLGSGYNVGDYNTPGEALTALKALTTTTGSGNAAYSSKNSASFLFSVSRGVGGSTGGIPAYGKTYIGIKLYAAMIGIVDETVPGATVSFRVKFGTQVANGGEMDSLPSFYSVSLASVTYQGPAWQGPPGFDFYTRRDVSSVLALNSNNDASMFFYYMISSEGQDLSNDNLVSYAQSLVITEIWYG